MARLVNVPIIVLVVIRRASYRGCGGGGANRIDRTVTAMTGILVRGLRRGGGGVSMGAQDNFSQGPLSLTQCCKDLGVTGGRGSGTAVIVDLQARIAVRTVIDWRL